MELFSVGYFPKVVPLQPIAELAYVAIFVRGIIPQSHRIAAHCSHLLLGDFSEDVITQKLLNVITIATPSYIAISARVVGNSSKVLPLQPIATNTYMAISVRVVGNSSKVFPLPPTTLKRASSDRRVILQNSSR